MYLISEIGKDGLRKLLIFFRVTLQILLVILIKKIKVGPLRSNG